MTSSNDTPDISTVLDGLDHDEWEAVVKQAHDTAQSIACEQGRIRRALEEIERLSKTDAKLERTTTQHTTPLAPIMRRLGMELPKWRTDTPVTLVHVLKHLKRRSAALKVQVVIWAGITQHLQTTGTRNCWLDPEGRVK